MNIFVVNELLKLSNITCDSALKGSVAIKMINDRIEQYSNGTGQLYKLILLDFSMPEMDGPEVAREIAKIYRENPLLQQSQMPFICCCTAYTEAQFRDAALDSGMNHFLSKPISSDELQQLLTLTN